MKSLRITSHVIKVSANRYAETGMIASLDIRGILPGCRKNATLSYSPCHKRISVRNLFSYSGHADIDPSEWQRLILQSPVVSDKLSPVVITPEIERWAIEHVLSVCNCPAVISTEHVHRDYVPPACDPLEIVGRPFESESFTEQARRSA